MSSNISILGSEHESGSQSTSEAELSEEQTEHELVRRTRLLGHSLPVYHHKPFRLWDWIAPVPSYCRQAIAYFAFLTGAGFGALLKFPVPIASIPSRVLSHGWSIRTLDPIAIRGLHIGLANFASFK